MFILKNINGRVKFLKIFLGNKTVHHVLSIFSITGLHSSFCVRPIKGTFYWRQSWGVILTIDTERSLAVTQIIITDNNHGVG